MLSVPATIWNQVAKQSLLTDWGRAVLPLPQDELEDEMATEAAELRKAGEAPRVIVAFQTVRPLLLEQQAIYKLKGGNPELEGVLPEVFTVDEALHLAVREFSLTAPEVRRLRRLLTSSVQDQIPE
jgi:hypothetical protein